MLPIWRSIGIRMTLRTKFVTSLVLVFLLLAVIITGFQALWVNRLVVDSTTDRVKQNIHAAWQVLEGQKRQLEWITAFLCEKPELQTADLAHAERLSALLAAYRTRWALDVLEVFPISALEQACMPEIVPPLTAGEATLSGYSVVSLRGEGEYPRLMGLRTDSKTILLYAVQRLSSPLGTPLGYLIAGIDLREANLLVDHMQNILFEDRFFRGKRVGTVTIFMGPERIATTVLLDSGERAVGTMVSSEVASQTLEQGVSWTGRAKVVDDWYLARYDPIRDINRVVIGMLYVGELEAVSVDIRRKTLFTILGVMTVVMAFALWVRLRITKHLLKQIESLRQGTQRFAEGDYSARVAVSGSEDEIEELAHSFNAMAQVIEGDREELMRQKQEIEHINASYMEMLGFVTHELRSTLGSALFNVLSLKEGAYGALDDDQREGLGLVEESLSYLDEITNNYLQLSRIEKGELYINKTPVAVRAEVIEPVLAGLKHLCENRNMQVSVQVPHDLVVPADVNLLRVVYENLVGNAVKYGCEHGHISLEAREDGDMVWLMVWNEGKTIEPSVLPTLFHKFRRYDVDETTGRKGTGLGLFIVKQIAGVHGGEVRVESGAGAGTRFFFSLPRS